MPVESDSDRAVFINADEFGAAVIYTSILTGLPIEISAAWFEPSNSVGINEISTDSTRPELSFRAIDVPDPREGDTARRKRDGRTMQIATPIQPDGEGFFTCALVAIDDC
jgi:hypothetical protein